MSHWQPSRLAFPPSVSPEDAQRVQQEQLHPYNISRSAVGSMDREAAGFRTAAEHPHAVAPFLAANMQQDYRQRHLQERTYLVLAGGDTLYHTPVDLAHREPLPIPERMDLLLQRQGGPLPPDLPRYSADFPSASDAMGHVPKGSK